MSKSKTKVIHIKSNMLSITTYYLYREVNGLRKYLGSVQKKNTSDDILRNMVLWTAPAEAWTWKRGSAMAFRSETDAKAVRTLINFGRTRIEEKVVCIEI